MPLRILLAPFGSEGDVNPLIWLAKGLRDRGHHPTFLITPAYHRLIAPFDFDWRPVGTAEDFNTFARNPKLWDGLNGPRLVLAGMIDSFENFERAFAATDGAFDLVVCSSLGMAPSTMAEARGIPRLIVHMQPICLQSASDFPVTIDELAWLRKTPIWFRNFFFQAVNKVVWNRALTPINHFRARHQLPPARDFYHEVLHGAQGGAALFPHWFAAAQPDWPSNTRQFGFPLTKDTRPLPPELETFLQAGPPPLVWTHGSANFDIDHFQQQALRTSAVLRQRCLLISLDPPRQKMPPDAFHFGHARFEDVFPRCRLAIHHGGIGTTSKAVLAGIPQLIIPRSHDQPDNAHRIERLGLGRHLHYRDLDRAALARNLRELLDDPQIPATCTAYRTRLRAENPLPEICSWAEEIASLRAAD